MTQYKKDNWHSGHRQYSILTDNLIKSRSNHQLATAGLKSLPALDYSINVLASNVHFTNRANSFPIFGNSSKPRNVIAKCVRYQKHIQYKNKTM